MADAKISALTELTAPVAGDYIPIVDTSAAATKKVDWGRICSALNVLNYGVETDGVTDYSTEIIALADSTHTAGGGTIYFPPGVYVCEGLPIYDDVVYVGDNWFSTQLVLPASPTNHLFASLDPLDPEYPVTGKLRGGGIKRLRITGGSGVGSKSAYNGVDLYNYSICETHIIEDCYIEYFTCGIRGSQDDRDNWIQNNTLYGNKVGYYIDTNHPKFSGVNDIFNNDYGIGGSPFDVDFQHQRFFTNGYGLWPLPDDGRSGSLTSTIPAIVTPTNWDESPSGWGDGTALGTDPLSTTNTSATVVVTHAAHGFINLTVVTLFGAVDTNGITAANINGRRTIANVTTNTYEITAGAAATSTGTGGGSNIEDGVANKARPGGHTPSYTGNPCSEMTINSCQFSNLYGDLMITERCTVTSNLFLGTSGGDKNSSVYITKNNNNVSTNRFRDDGVYPYKTGCVTLGPVKNGSGALIEQNKICNNVAILTDTESMGFLVKETRFPGAQGYEKMFGIDISGNNVKISYASTGNGGFLVNTRKATYAGQFYPFSRSKISNNICEVVNGANIEMIYVNNADTRAGNLIQNNQLKWQTAGGGRHIKAPIVDSVLSGNYMQTHTAGASHGLERTQTTGLVLLTADLTTTVAATAVADGDGLLNVLANG